MDIVSVVSNLDTQFKRGLLSAADYAWELQAAVSIKLDDLRTTYTIVHLVDGEVAGKSKESTLSEVKEAARCYKCLEDSSCPCDTDGFLSELQATGKAVKVDYDPFGTTVITAYKNAD